MRITDRLKLAALFPAGVVFLVVVLSQVWAFSRQSEGRERREEVERVMVEVFELTLLSDAYLRTHAERPKMQWHLRYEKLGFLLAAMRAEGEEQQEYLDRVRRNHAVLGKLFTALVGIRDERGRYTDLSLRDYAEGLLTGQLLIRARDITSAGVRLLKSINEEISARERSAFFTVLFLITALTAFIGTASLLLTRAVARSLSALARGTEIIGSGDLSFRIRMREEDEIGDLARSFDSMAGRLQSITVSRDDLAREVEERKRIEGRLREALEGLEASNKDLEQFAYVASHDLQEPLRMVSSYVQLLGRRYKGKLDRDADEFIAFAVDGALRMQGLINDLLTYSRVSTRGKPFGPVDCNRVIGEATDNLRLSIRESGAIVTHDPLPTIRADSAQMAQLFQNLIGNALKFRGGQPPRVHAAAEEKEEEWVFRVRDNGIGIEPRFFERIFLVFQRLHGGGEYPGTGIGLAVCKRIVERHGGRIWVESRPGEGSTFYFTIPKKGGEAHGQGEG